MNHKSKGDRDNRRNYPKPTPTNKDSESKPTKLTKGYSLFSEDNRVTVLNSESSQTENVTNHAEKEKEAKLESAPTTSKNEGQKYEEPSARVKNEESKQDSAALTQVVVAFIHLSLHGDSERSKETA